MSAKPPDAGPVAVTAGDFNIVEFLRNLTTRPGVYRMLDASGEIIYVGKAHALRARVSSYFHGGAFDVG